MSATFVVKVLSQERAPISFIEGWPVIVRATGLEDFFIGVLETWCGQAPNQTVQPDEWLGIAGQAMPCVQEGPKVLRDTMLRWFGLPPQSLDAVQQLCRLPPGELGLFTARLRWAANAALVSLFPNALPPIELERVVLQVATCHPDARSPTYDEDVFVAHLLVDALNTTDGPNPITDHFDGHHGDVGKLWRATELGALGDEPALMDVPGIVLGVRCLDRLAMRVLDGVFWEEHRHTWWAALLAGTFGRESDNAPFEVRTWEILLPVGWLQCDLRGLVFSSAA